MTEDALSQPEQPQAADDSDGGGEVSLTLVRQALTVLVVVVAVAWLLYLLSTHNALGDAWTTQVMLCGVALLAAAWGAVHRHHHWTVPLRHLREHVWRVYRGEATIESLSDVTGGPAELVPLFQDLLRDVRVQKAEVAALEAEMRRRMAHRTDALERTIESLRHQATRDALTGLFNRRFLDSFLPQAVQKCQQTKAELCLLMIDVDHFKKLNDTLGHPAGDALLKSIGQIIRSTARGEDVAFRFGGDEFLVVMLGSGERAGKALSDRITSLVDALCKTYHVTPRPRLSVGLVAAASLPEGQAATVEALLAEADKRLYAMKASHHAEHGPAPRSGPAAHAPAHAVPHAVPHPILNAVAHPAAHTTPHAASISAETASARPAA
jgi:diguanylate cyclase (GGDEF)-like protein